MKLKKTYLAYTLIFIFAFLSGCGREPITDNSQKSTARATADSLKNDNPISDIEDSDFLLPDAQIHIYTEEELDTFTEEELRLARNEIYARHGRKFTSEDLQQYFSEKSWYHGLVEADQFDDQILNEFERENLKLILQMESKQSFCMIPKMGVDEFPKLNGSTATLPISQAMYCMATGASLSEAEAVISHDKTTNAWMSLLNEESEWYTRPELIIAYEPGEQVREAFREADCEILIKPIGMDALIFLTNASNPVTSLTADQIADIYTGKINNWKTVGGRDQKILAFQRPVHSGSQNLMEKLVMKNKKMTDAPVDLLAGDMGDLMESVSAYDNTGNALGYSVYYYARNMYQKPQLSFLSVNQIAPSNDTIRRRSYPFVNDFYAAIRADEPKDSRAYELFEWLTSEDGQSLINGLGYVGVDSVQKKLPEDIMEQEEISYASIPLPKDYVILGSGPMLYGEAGIGIFDSDMKLLTFLSHIESYEVSSFLECEKDKVIPVRDTITGKEGYYSIGQKKWLDTYHIEEKNAYILASTFAQDHPELLLQYNVTEDAVETKYYDEIHEPVIAITKGTTQYFYSAEGYFLLEYDTQGREDTGYVFPVDEHTAYQSFWKEDCVEYDIYRDGVLIKKLKLGENENLSGIFTYFYVVNRGNYKYLYNYEDELCAKFMQGYLWND